MRVELQPIRTRLELLMKSPSMDQLLSLTIITGQMFLISENRINDFA